MTDPTRILLSRAQGWRKPPETRVVARNTILGNPWVVGAEGAYCWPRGTRVGWQSSHRIPARTRGRHNAGTSLRLARRSGKLDIKRSAPEGQPGVSRRLFQRGDSGRQSPRAFPGK